MTHVEFLELFLGSAIRRATYQGLRRNAALVLGNTGSDEETLRLLRQVAEDDAEDAVVREQAEWSARRVRARIDAAAGPS
jgi:epoxyqueuosine reductase